MVGMVKKMWVVVLVLNFGDPLVDNGKINQLQSLARADYLPYGIDFGGPTGRFSNGKTVVDAVAMKHYIIAGSLHLEIMKEKVEVDKEKLRVRKLEAENRKFEAEMKIMSMDTSTMNPEQRAYYSKLQMKILQGDI